MDSTNAQFPVLITGGAGFIGSRLTARLLSLDYPCLVVDNLSAGLPPPAAHPQLSFRQEDICERKKLEQAVSEFAPRLAVHLAAIHHIPTCEKHPAEALRVNVFGFQALLDALADSPCSKIVLASSGAVYDWQAGPLREDSSRVQARDVYSLSKITNELQLRLWVERSGRAGTIARIFNTIGPGDPNAHLIPDILRQLGCGNGHTVVRLGNLTPKRDYICVEDTAACLAAMVRAARASGLVVFYVGSGTEHDVSALVRQIASIRKLECAIEVDPARVRKVDRPTQLADMAHTSSRLQWQAQYSFREAVRLAVQMR